MPKALPNFVKIGFQMKNIPEAQWAGFAAQIETQVRQIYGSNVQQALEKIHNDSDIRDHINQLLHSLGKYGSPQMQESMGSLYGEIDEMDFYEAVSGFFEGLTSGLKNKNISLNILLTENPRDNGVDPLFNILMVCRPVMYPSRELTAVTDRYAVSGQDAPWYYGRHEAAHIEQFLESPYLYVFFSKEQTKRQKNQTRHEYNRENPLV